MKTQNTTLYIILGSIVATIYATIFVFGIDSPVKCALIFTTVIAVLLFLVKIVYPFVPVIRDMWQKINVNVQKKIIFVIILVLFTAACLKSGWLIYYEPALKGTILDIDTKQPIEGVVVAVEYSKETIGLGAGGISSILNWRETLTDKDGHFRIPSYITIIQPFSWKNPNGVVIYKPGYISLYLGTWHFNGEETREVLDPWSKGVEYWSSGLVYRLAERGVVELPRTRTPEQREKEQNDLINFDSKRADKLPIIYRMMNSVRLR